MRSDQVDQIAAKLSKHDYRLDLWDVFMANREEAEHRTSAILENGPPEGFFERSPLEDDEHPDTKEVQYFMVDNGVVPFSGSMLTSIPWFSKRIFLAIIGS